LKRQLECKDRIFKKSLYLESALGSYALVLAVSVDEVTRPAMMAVRVIVASFGAEPSSVH
jgi:hypothetical protein